MITSVEELNQANKMDSRVVNGVDNANLMSVDSTEPVEMRVDSVENGEENVVVVVEKPAEKKEEEEEEVKVKVEESAPEESQKQEVSESVKVQKRIGELTKKFRTAERERDFERSKRLEAEAKLNEILAKTPVVGKPQKADYEDEEAYIEALTDWKVDSKFLASQNKAIAEASTAEEKETVLATYETLDTVMEKGKEKYSDFNELAFAVDLVLSPEVVQLSLDTENPEDVLYFLISNPEESERISSLGGIKAAKEIGKIEVKLSKVEEKPSKDEESKSKALPKKQSQAPAPITPVVTTGSVDKDPSAMSAKEYRAWREKKNK